MTAISEKIWTIQADQLPVHQSKVQVQVQVGCNKITVHFINIDCRRLGRCRLIKRNVLD